MAIYYASKEHLPKRTFSNDAEGDTVRYVPVQSIRRPLYSSGEELAKTVRLLLTVSFKQRIASEATAFLRKISRDTSISIGNAFLRLQSNTIVTWGEGYSPSYVYPLTTGYKAIVAHYDVGVAACLQQGANIR